MNMFLEKQLEEAVKTIQKGYRDMARREKLAGELYNRQIAKNKTRNQAMAFALVVSKEMIAYPHSNPLITKPEIIKRDINRALGEMNNKPLYWFENKFARILSEAEAINE